MPRASRDESLHRLINMPVRDETVVRQLVSSLAGDIICAEVGTWTGNTAKAMIEAGASRVYCIDHWLGSDHDPSGAFARQYGQRKLFEQFCVNVAEYLPDKIVPLVGTSELWASVLPHQSFDFIFIDAGHEYEEAMQDIILWLPHVKPGGILAGHDYAIRMFPGVTQAVHEFAESRPDLDHYPKDLQPGDAAIWWTHIPEESSVAGAAETGAGAAAAAPVASFINP